MRAIFDGEIERSTKGEYTPGQRNLANKVLTRLAPMPPSLCEALDEIAEKAGDKWLVDDEPTDLDVTPTIKTRSIGTRFVSIVCVIAVMFLAIAISNYLLLRKVRTEQERLNTNLADLHERQLEQDAVNQQFATYICRQLSELTFAPTFDGSLHEPDDKKFILLARTLDTRYFVETLSHSEPTVRRGAAIVLEKVEVETNGVTDALVKLLNDPDGTIRICAALALVANGSGKENVVPSLLLGIQNDTRYYDCVRAVATLGELAKSAESVLSEELYEQVIKSDGINSGDTLIDALQAIHPEVKVSLGDFFDLATENMDGVEFGFGYMNARVTSGEVTSFLPDDIPSLIENANDESVEVRRRVAQSVATNWAQQRWTENGHQQRVDLLRNMLSDTDANVRIDAAIALVNIGGNADADVLLSHLTDGAFKGDERNRKASIRALGKFANRISESVIERKVKNVLLKVLSESSDDDTRYVAAIAIRSIETTYSQIARVVLVEAMSSENRAIRLLAVISLRPSEYGKDTTVALPILIDLLSSKDKNYRRFAAWALGNIGKDAKSAVPSILKELDGPLVLDDKDYQYLLANALVGIGSHFDRAIPILIEALKSRSSLTRSEAAMALGEAGPYGKPAKAALINALNDEDEDVRNSARRALKEINKQS